MPKVKITVVKKLNMNDIYGEKLPGDVKTEILVPECQRFKVGQEFILDFSKRAGEPGSWEDCPPGFCTWAYADIQRDITHILFGGSYPWMNEKGAVISCCTDGLRPVIFRIERIED